MHSGSTRNSCERCRIKKLRCERQSHDKPDCGRCIRARVGCVYGQSRRGRRPNRPLNHTKAHSENAELSIQTDADVFWCHDLLDNDWSMINFEGLDFETTDDSPATFEYPTAPLAGDSAPSMYLPNEVRTAPASTEAWATGLSSQQDAPTRHQHGMDETFYGNHNDIFPTAQHCETTQYLPVLQEVATLDTDLVQIGLQVSEHRQHNNAYGGVTVPYHGLLDNFGEPDVPQRSSYVEAIFKLSQRFQVALQTALVCLEHSNALSQSTIDVKRTEQSDYEQNCGALDATDQLVDTPALLRVLATYERLVTIYGALFKNAAMEGFQSPNLVIAVGVCHLEDPSVRLDAILSISLHMLHRIGTSVGRLVHCQSHREGEWRPIGSEPTRRVNDAHSRPQTIVELQLQRVHKLQLDLDNDLGKLQRDLRQPQS